MNIIYFLVAATFIGLSITSVSTADTGTYQLDNYSTPAQVGIPVSSRRSKPLPIAGIDFVNEMGMTMVWVERGSFSMGSSSKYSHYKPNEGPLHEVIVRNGFWIGRMEVSQKLYQKISRLNPSRHKDPEAPVSSVRYHEALEFCHRLNEMEAKSGTLPSGFEYNLPSEVQWEYAARTDKDGKDLLSEPGLSTGGWNSETVLFDGTRLSIHQQKVGTSKVSPRGLYDMCGNLWEWCLDNYHPNYGGAATDERIWLEGGSDYEKVIRGGAYLSLPSDCTPVKRSSRSPSRESQTQGFRVALSVSSLYAISGSMQNRNSTVDGPVKVSGSSSSSNVNAKESLPEPPEIEEVKVPLKIEPATISINSLGMRMVWIPKGKVDDGTDLSGEVGKGFWMGACEVTQKEYEKLMGSNPSQFKNDERPVDSVSFGDAHRFCKALSEKEKKSYRLPNTLEWKHALYANGSSLIYGGLKEIAWIKGQSRGRISTKPVGSKSGNGYGLFDMVGNVAEWTDSILMQVKGFDKGSRTIPGFICSGADMAELMKKTKSGCSVNTKKSEVKPSMFSRSDPGAKDKFTGFRVVYQ